MKFLIFFVLIGCFSCSEDKIALQRELEKDPLALKYGLANSIVTFTSKALTSSKARDKSLKNLQKHSRMAPHNSTELFKYSQMNAAYMRNRYQISLEKKNAYYKTLYEKYVVNKKMSSKTFESVLAQKGVDSEKYLTNMVKDLSNGKRKIETLSAELRLCNEAVGKTLPFTCK
jgi:hypothetical protein